MTKNALAKPSKELKSSVSRIGDHLNAIQRAREIYQSGMKRLEHEYAERIKHAALIFDGEEEPAPTTGEPEGGSGTPPPVDVAA